MSDTLINSIMGLSVGNDFAQLLTALKGADNIWSNQQINLLEAASRLDATQHSLGMLYILYVMLFWKPHAAYVPLIGYLELQASTRQEAKPWG